MSDRPCRCGWGGQRCCWTAWPRAGTTTSGCRACEVQRAARPRASAPRPVSAPPFRLLALWAPQAPHGAPVLAIPCPGHPPPPPHAWGGPEALVCSAAALGPPRHLNFSDVSHDSARVSWEGSPRPIRLVRVSYVSSKGGHSGQVRAGPVAARGAVLSRGGGVHTGRSILSAPSRHPAFGVSPGTLASTGEQRAT